MEHRAEGQLRLSVIVFLTLQHRVVVGGKLGPLHSHSCSVEVEVSPPQGDTIPFAEIEAEIKAQITPLDGKTLNDLANFQGMNPTVENLAAHLYNRLLLITAEYGAVLHAVTVRESPTRAVKYVREDLPEMAREDSEIDNLRRVRGPVGQIPPSPNQRPSSDFELGNRREASGDETSCRSEQAEARARDQAVTAAEGSDPAPSAGSVAFAAVTPVQDGEAVAEVTTRIAPEAPAFGPSEIDDQLLPPEGLPSRKDRKRKGGKGTRASHGRPVPARAEMGYEESPAAGEMRLASSADSSASNEPDGPLAVPAFSRRRAVLTSLILLALIAATAFIYRRILWPPPGLGYPWGSDTWGHIQKAQFLLHEILNRNYFPNFSPMWYNGMEPFRYWAPLPYYLLAGLMRLLGDPFLAAGWYVGLCAFTGGAGWLLMKDRLGLLGSGLAGFIWIFWQDNVRVAMSEGNLPRVLATALFPYLMHCFLLVVEKPWKKGAGRFTALAAVSSLVILAHAMIAATFFAGLTILAGFWALWMGVRARDVARGVLGIFAGIGLAAWWLAPSLQSGIVAIDKEAVIESMQYFPITVSMNPFLRQKQPEIFYWGISLIVVAAIVILTWKSRTPLSQSGILVAGAFVALSTPQLKPIYSSIPMSYLVFPLYMATMASGIAVLCAFGWKKRPSETVRDGLRKFAVSALVAVILAVDSYPSTSLIDTRAEPVFLKELARHIPTGGWREATLDLSRFGSAATYILGFQTGREQVYGWAWQGATTATNIVGLNSAAQCGFYPYLVDRLVELGATDLVVRRNLMDDAKLLTEAGKLGFVETFKSAEAMVLSSGGGPYVLKTDYRGIVIGKFALNWTQLFPSLATGAYNQIDRYSYEDLSLYPVVVISGAGWEDRTKAEDLVNRLASGGTTVIIDLEGLPEDVLSKRPMFLGVTGEPVLIYKAPQVFRPGDPKPVGTLQAFSEEHYPWKALSPQGADSVVYQFPYLGENVALLASKDEGPGAAKVWYVGANLPYHAYLTRDPFALKILSEVLGVAPSQTPVRSKIPLNQYSATARGYSFNLVIPAEWRGVPITIPIASRENMVVKVDGVQVRSGSLHNLIRVSLDPGPHSVEIVPLYPASMKSGALVSLGCLVFLILLWGSEAAVEMMSSRRRQVVAG